MGLCPSCIRRLVTPRRPTLVNEALTPQESLRIDIDAVGVDNVDTEAERQSTERYIASTRASENLGNQCSPTAQLLQGEHSTCPGTTCARGSDSDSDTSAFGGFSQSLAPDHCSHIPAYENARMPPAPLDFKHLDTEGREDCHATMLDGNFIAQPRRAVHEFFVQNVPSCVRLAEWEMRNEVSPQPSYEELMDRVIERVEITQKKMTETYMCASGAESVLFPKRRRCRRKQPVEPLTTTRSFAPPSHRSLVRRVLE